MIDFSSYYYRMLDKHLFVEQCCLNSVEYLTTQHRRLHQLVHMLSTQQKIGSKYKQKSKLQSSTSALSKGHQYRNWALVKQWNRRGEHLFAIIKCKYKQPVLNGTPHCIAHCWGPPRLSKIEYTICLSGAFPLVSGTDGMVLALLLSFP